MKSKVRLCEHCKQKFIGTACPICKSTSAMYIEDIKNRMYEYNSLKDEFKYFFKI